MANTRYPSITPGTTPFNDNNGGQKLGEVFSVASATKIDGAYFYAPVAHSDYHFELSANGVIIAEAVSAVVVGDNFIPFPSPAQLSPSVDYTLAVAVYPQAGHQFDTAISDYTAVAFAGGTDGPFTFKGGRYADQNVTTTTVPTTSSPNWYGIGPYIADTVVVTPPDDPEDPPTDPGPTDPTPVAKLWFQDESGKWYLFGGSPASAAAHPGIFYPEDYGAKGDGTTDDTAAWNNCIAAAVAAAPQHNYAVVVEGQSEEYLIGTAPVKGRQFGNAQITIPHVPASTSRKITLVIRGRSIASTFLHWDQVAPQSIGTVLHSTYAGGSYDGTWGVPSILGGPTNLSGASQDQFATFSNMHVVIDGISTLQPAGASLIAFDFRRIGQAHVASASSFSNRTRKTTPPIETLTTNDQSAGLVMPFKGNNARSAIGSYTAEGLYSAVIASEHLDADYIGAIYCRNGVQIAGLTAGDYSDGQRRIGDHSIHIGRFLAEAVDYWVYNDSAATQLIIDSMGGEGTTNFVAHVYDQISGESGRGGLTGRINLLDIFQRYPVVEGRTSLRITNDAVLPGAAYTNPAVPASNTELQNPFWRDATAVVTGGTVTSIKVEGVDMGVTSGPIPVATGQRIAITYSSVPTWKWVLA
jgi:hypothetical protein